MTMFAMGSKQELLGDMLCVMFLGIGIMAPGIWAAAKHLIEFKGTDGTDPSFQAAILSRCSWVTTPSRVIVSFALALPVCYAWWEACIEGMGLMGDVG